MPYILEQLIILLENPCDFYSVINFVQSIQKEKHTGAYLVFKMVTPCSVYIVVAPWKMLLRYLPDFLLFKMLACTSLTIVQVNASVK